MNKINLLFLLLLVCCSSCNNTRDKEVNNTRNEEVRETFRLSSIPHELSWYNTALNKEISGDSISITGGKSSRLFVDPQRLSRADSAPMALFTPDETFLFSCKIKVDFAAVFDAGVLMIYSDSTQWAKLCFEYTPQHERMVVSVVNNELSDDSNHSLIEGNEIYARVAGLGNGAYAFHYSLDGKYWNMARYFHLDPGPDYKIGFLSQSPQGEQCKSVFTEIKYSSEKLENLRNGE